MKQGMSQSGLKKRVLKVIGEADIREQFWKMRLLDNIASFIIDILTKRPTFSLDSQISSDDSQIANKDAVEFDEKIVEKLLHHNRGGVNIFGRRIILNGCSMFWNLVKNHMTLNR
uniref:Uncharacterized protein n=1 Tax=Rhabditophanes sp. KR3021 TaxID=114890 RepID=A0AC35TUV4_9BILA